MADDSRELAGRYRLERLLGRGGMGQVWLARDEMLGRAVAVKEIRFPAGLGDDERDLLRERTMREARLTARLSHPNIVTVYDVVLGDGHPCIVMELVPAPSLADVIDEHGPLEPSRVVRIGLALLDALDAAHEGGVVHRDVKPSNVLLGDDRVVLTDFGIATSDTDATLTATGLLVGSPTYMSPERLRGERIGPPADIWSLGTTLYAALEAHPPFRAETTMGTITAVLTDEAPPPRVHGPLRDALAGMLEKSPDVRLTSGSVRVLLDRAVEVPPRPTSWVVPNPVAPVMAPAVAHDEPYVDVVPPTEPSEAQPGSQLKPQRAPGRRSRAVALMIAVLLALAAGGLVLADQLGGGDDPGGVAAVDDTTQKAGNGPRSGPGTSGEPSDETTPTATATTETTQPPSRPSVPDGYTLVRDPLGFRVAVPDGWSRQLAAETRVDYISPDGTAFLRIDQQPQAGPSAEQAWLDAEPGVAARLPGYSLIGIDPVDYRYPAADWEFTWEGSGGTVHVLNRGIVTDPRGFALYMSGPDATWEAETLPVFQAAAASFRPNNAEAD